MANCTATAKNRLKGVVVAMKIKFEGLKRTVSFDGVDEIMPVLEKVISGWQFKRVNVAKVSANDICLARGPVGYERTSPWLDGGKMVLANPVDAVCDLVLDLERAFITDSEKLHALHAAAVKLGDGLSIFPSTHNSGKSTLALLLAIRGARLFADDVTPIFQKFVGGKFIGVSPGILPRLRLPLPHDLAPQSTDFINSHKGPESEKFLYVNLNKKHLAPLGESATVNRIILLERENGVETSLAPVKKSEILKHTIMQSLNQDVSAMDMLDKLNAMVADAECLCLRYEKSEDAAELLISTFANAK